MAIVAFDVAMFRARYPEFSSASDLLLASFFNEAGLYLSNTDASIVQDVTRRRLLLNMLTAHIAALSGATGGGAGAAPVGRTSSATEGSVSASSEFVMPGTHAWFTQTQYGAAYWQATINLRSFTYVAQPTRY